MRGKRDHSRTVNGLLLFLKAHPAAYEFLMFNIMSNVATVVNFAVLAQAVNFVVQRKVVFGATGRIGKTIPWYILPVAVNYPIMKFVIMK